mgnify:FL=1
MKAKDKAIAEGRNPYELADGEYVTSCTEVCPNGAISFGDSKNPEHKVYELIRSPQPSAFWSAWGPTRRCTT